MAVALLVAVLGAMPVIAVAVASNGGKIDGGTTSMWRHYMWWCNVNRASGSVLNGGGANVSMGGIGGALFERQQQRQRQRFSAVVVVVEGVIIGRMLATWLQQ